MKEHFANKSKQVNFSKRFNAKRTKTQSRN